MGTQTGIYMAHDTLPLPRRGVATALDAGAWFEAVSPFGPLRLCAFAAGGTVRHAVGAAIALHRCEALLEALHGWTGVALDWRWRDAAVSVAPASHATLRWRPAADTATGPGVECLVALPWALLRTLAAPPAALAAQLSWPAVPVVLAVSQFRIGEDELQQIEPGGAIVLPDSLLLPWHGMLRSAHEPARAGVGVPVAQPSPWTPRLVRSCSHAPAPAAEIDDGRIACEVRLAAPHTLPADRLAGWFDGEPVATGGPLASLWRCADIVGDACRLAVGRLMPWGDGWALGVETLEIDDATLR